MLEFISGPAPKGFKPDFESFLFNTPPHRLTQSKTGWKEFHLLERARKRILASVAFHIQGKKASSPCRAPFGSFELSEKVEQSDLLHFILNVEKHLKKIGISQIEISHPPALYTGLHNRVVAALLCQDYSATQCDISCSIKVDQNPLPRMDSTKRNRFQYGVKAGFTFKKLAISKLKEVYLFIESCLARKKQTLSLSLNQLQESADALPKAFQLFAVYNEKQIIAATVCVHVGKSILYTFYSTHNKEFDQASPLTFLLGNLYNWCRVNGIILLDMGTSTVRGKTNFSLLDYKLRVGGVLSPKFTFRKRLSR